MSVKDYKHPELCLTGRRNQLVAQVNHVVWNDRWLTVCKMAGTSINFYGLCQAMLICGFWLTLMCQNWWTSLKKYHNRRKSLVYGYDSKTKLQSWQWKDPSLSQPVKAKLCWLFPSIMVVLCIMSMIYKVRQWTFLYTRSPHDAPCHTSGMHVPTHTTSWCTMPHKWHTCADSHNLMMHHATQVTHMCWLTPPYDAPCHTSGTHMPTHTTLRWTMPHKWHACADSHNLMMHHATQVTHMCRPTQPYDAPCYTSDTHVLTHTPLWCTMPHKWHTCSD
jgi:hypothetical protein